jgi:hypothetical protein
VQVVRVACIDISMLLKSLVSNQTKIFLKGMVRASDRPASAEMGL